MKTLVRYKLAEKMMAEDPNLQLEVVSNVRFEKMLIKSIEDVLKKIKIHPSPDLFAELFELNEALLKCRNYGTHRIASIRKEKNEEQGDYSKKYAIESGNRK